MVPARVVRLSTAGHRSSNSSDHAPRARAPEYVELHCHSAYSLLDGASLPEELVERAVALGHRALALTDHDELGGVVAFAQAAHEREIAGIIGAEITVAGTMGMAAARGDACAADGAGASDVAGAAGAADSHLVLLAMDREGYGNLSTLVTRARMDNPRGKPRVPFDLVARHARGLFALTGCLRGRVPSLVARGELSAARDAAATLRDIFDGRVAIECWYHGLAEERAVVLHLMGIARDIGVQWVVTNDVHYAAPDARATHDVLCALRHKRPLAEMGTRLRPNGEWYLKSAAQMWRRWRHHPEALRATLAIAERCTFRMRDLRPSLPKFPLPPGVTADDYLASLVAQGAWERWGEAKGSRKQEAGSSELHTHNVVLPASFSPLPSPFHRKQITHELSVIRQLGLAGYFLIVWDIVRFARREGILCQGRGSAANSAVCFCLGITAVDPIEMGLLFERFLSDERQETPDIDIDFAHRDREKVLQYVYERYGREHAAMVCEQITYKEKSAKRDVERVLGGSAHRAPGRGRGTDGTGDSGRTLANTIASRLLRLPRHRSIHVGGFVLTEEPLHTVVPIEPASMADRTVVQWEKDDVEAMGLVKIDLLGLGMLTLLQDCIRHIRAMRGVTVDLAALDYADQAVYDDLCRADTIGVFQVESRAQMNTLPRLKPRRFYDLVVEVALIRPGPIQGEMVHPYLRRRAGEEEVTYPHPALEHILERTLGVPLFQEQGMRVAIEAAGFTPGEADTLRRAMGHKRSRERMAAICEKLIEGMQRNGIPEDTARRIYSQINAFADYGFPESHAASFALLVYASAYLKHYYTPEFTAAILNAQPMGFYSPGTLIEDARRHGVTILPMDVTRSMYDCTLEHGPSAAPMVRLGLRMVKGLGARAREKLERALHGGGSFRSIGDLIERSGLDRRALRALADAGALDSFVIDEPLRRRRRAAVWRMLEEFRGEAGPLAPSRPNMHIPPSVPALSSREITAADYRLTGVSLNGHPMLHLRRLLAPNGVRTAREVHSLADGTRDVAVAGIVICRQRPPTAKGFVFLTLEDETGLVNVIVPPKRYEQQTELISTARLILVRGTLTVEQTVVNLRGEIFRALNAEVGAEGERGHDFH
ncbi:MAG TPA: error-prone DNA polymerase [Gemmatimonadaceae bacterium]|nr:error-prone DNA polymerase [Gemmatimonadaceae bacterium]